MVVEQILQCTLTLFSRRAGLCARVEGGLRTGRARGLHRDAFDPFDYQHSGFVRFHRLKPLLRPAAWAALRALALRCPALKAIRLNPLAESRLTRLPNLPPARPKLPRGF